MPCWYVLCPSRYLFPCPFVVFYFLLDWSPQGICWSSFLFPEVSISWLPLGMELGAFHIQLIVQSTAIFSNLLPGIEHGWCCFFYTAFHSRWNSLYFGKKMSSILQRHRIWKMSVIESPHVVVLLSKLTNVVTSSIFLPFRVIGSSDFLLILIILVLVSFIFMPIFSVVCAS